MIMSGGNHRYMDNHKETAGAARLSVYSNVSLLVLKLAVGFMMGSVAVLSEAIHSGMDLVAALFANYSIRRAGKPADRDHRFGHGKFENVSGTVEAMLIALAAAIILFEAGKKLLFGGTLDYLGPGIAVMGVSSVANFLISRRLMYVAKKAESIALEADAYHLSTDVLTSVGVFAGLVLIQLTGNAIFDPLLAIVVAVLILKASYDLTRRSLSGLMDSKLSDEEEEIIRSTISEHYPQFAGYHDLRTRMSGAERFVDLHLVVPRYQKVSDAHDFCDHIESDLKAKIPNLSLLIHMEPCDEGCEMCRKSGECKVNTKGKKR